MGRHRLESMPSWPTSVFSKPFRARMQMVAASVRKVQRVWRSKSTKKLSELLDEDEGDASPHGSSLREVLEAAKVDFTGAETMKTPLGAERGDAEASKQASEVVDAEVEGSEMADERLLEGYEEDFHDDDVVTEGQEESKVVSEALEEVEDAFVPATESVEVAVEVDRALALHLNRLSVDSMMQSMTDQPSTMYSGAFRICPSHLKATELPSTTNKRALEQESMVCLESRTV